MTAGLILDSTTKDAAESGAPRRTKVGMWKPKPCLGCRSNVVAWTKPRVDYCYQCLPGGPFPPPPCGRCGGTADTGDDYYSQGLCIRCHRAAPQHVEQCRDCLAWGVIRKYKWLCWRCHSWRARCPRGTCRFCKRPDLPLSDDQACVLCDRQHSIKPGLTLEEANAGGQQLFLANTPWLPTRLHNGVRSIERPSDPTSPTVEEPLVFVPVEPTQPTLLDAERDLAHASANGHLDPGRIADPPNEKMAAFIDAAVTDHARRHGWTASTMYRTKHSLHVLQLMQDHPGTMLLASDAIKLPAIGLTAIPVIDVATAVGIMLDDREPAIHNWVATTIADLPAGMQAEINRWFDIMLNGSDTPPRRKPREPNTIRQYLRYSMPALTRWANEGHTSLRDITPADVRAVLPATGNPRSTMGAGLRSILTLLKACKVLFLNPIARITTGRHHQNDPMPGNTELIRQALTGPNPAGAALAALATFHGLRAGQLRNLQLTDLADGRLHLGNRTIPLAEPVRERVAAWLDHRNRRWPNTANPYVFLNHRNATRTTPIGYRWLAIATGGVPIHVMREDRIVNEVRASGGDARRICDLFGLTMQGAVRYLPNDDLDSSIKTIRASGS